MVGTNKVFIPVQSWIKKLMPASIYEKIRAALIYAPNDPHNLHQVLPPNVNPTSVERIKGFRYPSPGSRGRDASIPTREAHESIYDTSYYIKDPRNLPKNDITILNSHKEKLLISQENPRKASHGKRKISLLPYDPSGLKTPKTVTWEALDKVLLANATPNHLPGPEWEKDIENMLANAKRKGLPVPVGRRTKVEYGPNYNTLKW